MNVHKVSIICPVYNEEKFIDRCIKSILEQDYPQDSLEVLFVDGRSTDQTRDIINSYLKDFPFIRLLDNPKQVVPFAMNKGIQESKGEVIIRIDGHCTYPTNYVSELVRYLYELDADNVGGVWNTQPANDRAICQAIALASSHPFGVGGSMHKIGTSKIMKTDTVPFGCYKREVFEKIGLFDTELVRNQAKADLCRTQQVIQLADSQQANYFLTQPIGNHHIITPGSNRRLFEDFIAAL